MEGCVSTFNNVYTGGNCLPMHCLALTHVIGDTRLYNCVAIATINTSHNINTSLNSTKCLSPHLEKMRMLNLKISKVINVTKFYHFNAHKKILFFLHYPICSEKLQDTGDCWPATTFYPNPHHCKIIFRNYSSFYCKDSIWHK